MDSTDQRILDDRTTARNAIKGPRVGDFVYMNDNTLRRFTHDWGDTIQVTSGIGGSGRFYLTESGELDYSGGLDPAIPKADLIDRGEIIEGDAWFFHHDIKRAHNGINVKVPCRVYEQRQS